MVLKNQNAFFWTGLIVSMLIVWTVQIYVILGIAGAGISIHLLLIKTMQENCKNQNEGEKNG